MNFVKKPKIGLLSLGCPKALVDSEKIITKLYALGYELVNAYNSADLIIVNTCGFLNSAQQESLETIAEALNQHDKVIVTGCLGIYPELIKQHCPKVLAITGPHQYDEVINLVITHTPTPLKQKRLTPPAQGLRLTPPHYAYLKISEGCNNKCSYCIIPKIRGRLKSRPLDEIFNEALNLAQAGVKEIIVISQDTFAYGRDLDYIPATINNQKYPTNIFSLCELLSTLGVWIRLHYLYPYAEIDKLIPYMAKGKILPYLDLPLQHVSPKILKAMKRPWIKAKMLEKIAKWRKLCPDLVLRSTFIIGFPGESDDDFECLRSWLQTAQLDRVGCFAFEAVNDASASRFADQIPSKITQKRIKKLMTLQAKISKAKLKTKTGSLVEAMVDAVDQEGAIARSYASSPEIDGYVFIDNGQKLKIGDWVTVKITDYSEHDLFGNLL